MKFSILSAVQAQFCLVRNSGFAATCILTFAVHNLLGWGMGIRPNIAQFE